MSLTHKAMQYMVHLEREVQNEEDALLFVGNARRHGLKKFDPNPQELTESYLKFGLNKMKGANETRFRIFNSDIAKKDIAADMAFAGLDINMFSNTQKRQLQWAKTFMETFRPDENFAINLRNASGNIKQSLHEQEKRHSGSVFDLRYSDPMDESILKSVAFDNGRGYGKEPDGADLVNALSHNPRAVMLMERLKEAATTYERDFLKLELPITTMLGGVVKDMYQSAAEKVTELLGNDPDPHRDKAREAGIGMALAATIGGSSLFSKPGAQPEYSRDAELYTQRAKEGSSYYDAAAEYFETIGYQGYTKKDAAVLLHASGLSDYVHATITGGHAFDDVQGDFVQFSVPSNLKDINPDAPEILREKTQALINQLDQGLDRPADTEHRQAPHSPSLGM